MADFDIAVIGGGPAGATFARLLDSRFRTALIDGKTDSENSFRKVCGGLLSPDAQKAFAEFDLTLPKDILVDPQIFSVRTGKSLTCGLKALLPKRSKGSAGDAGKFHGMQTALTALSAAETTARNR